MSPAPTADELPLDKLVVVAVVVNVVVVVESAVANQSHSLWSPIFFCASGPAFQSTATKSV